MRLVRVFIVSEVQLYLTALSSALGGCPGIEVVGAASSLRESRTALRPVGTDVVVIDLILNQRHRRALRAVAREAGDVHVVAVKRRGKDDEVVAWLEAGATAVVGHSASIADLQGVIVDLQRCRG